MGWDSRERRKFVRVKLPAKISIYTPQKHIIRAPIKDIGAGGVRFLIKQNLDIASIVNLEIQGIKKEPIACEGKVIWVNAKKRTYGWGRFLFDTGIEFYNISDKDRQAIKNLAVKIAAGNS